MAWNGDVLATLQEYMNERDMRDIQEDIKLRFPFFSRWDKALDKDTQYLGKYAIFRIKVNTPMNAGPRPESEDVMLPDAYTYAICKLYLKQYMASAGMTQEEFEQCKGEPLAAGNLVEEKIADMKLGMKVILNRAWLGDGTGRIARVSAWTNGSQTVAVDNTVADFGWAGLDRLENGMRVDIYGAGTNAKKQSAITIVSVDKKNDQITFAATAINVSNNDEIWLTGTKGTLSRFWNTRIRLSGILSGRLLRRATMGA